MGKHSEWRKQAKKAQRQRKRRETALIRSKLQAEEQQKRENSPSYQSWLKEQQKLEDFQADEELRISQEQEAQYQEREKAAQLKWQQLQKKLQLAREARAAQNLKIKEEWEAEQQRLKALQEEKARLEEERLLNEQQLQQQIDEFVNNNGEMPQELNQFLESNPGKTVCPFFSRTGACRFGDMCSRNHIRPTVSSVLLIKNFYSHYSLDAKENEHGDSSLEFDNHEIYKDFEAFFNDVVPEFESYGVVQQFKVCCNKEPHLRGNVYVGYSSCREAMRSYRRFQGRFYGGRQLNVEFCSIDSWKSAICGLFYRKRCPKGSVCNFLHVFRNPGNLFTKMDSERGTTVQKDNLKANDWNGSERSDWRWSSSPELTRSSKSDHLREIESDNVDRQKHRSKRDSSSRRRTSSRKRSRSRSRDRSRKRRSRSSSRHVHKSKHKSEKSSRRR